MKSKLTLLTAGDDKRKTILKTLGKYFLSEKTE
jgi:hypothetical protein